jgi:hypothetical protein
MTRVCHFVTGVIESSWSFTSCSPPRSLPIVSRGIWPAISRTGDETEKAVLRPPAAL